MGRLDRVPTRTRLARQGISTIEKSLTRTTQGRTARPILFTYSEIKVRAFNATIVTSYHHGYSRDRRENSTGVKSHFLLPIPGWEVKTCHYTTIPHTTLPPITLERGYDKVRTPRSREFSLIRSSSTRPRPSLDPASTYHRSAGRKGRCGTGLEVFSPSRPLHHHGIRGWPAIPGARRYSHLYRDR
jgi:hypothetical protein